ncbi:MAG: VCBS repeat-containing protein, partial [Pyrinomonadaceae bacterium]|nr:VCBS repeat-containing protein [Pyrinomonadaceae bacterium]
MKNLIGIAIALMIVMQTAVTAQPAGQLLLNEVENDPPPFENGCQYAEIRGANPGGTVPTGTYFISLDSNASNPGFLNTAVNFGGSVVGSNGTITLQNTLDSCPNRVFPTGTTVVNYFSGPTIGGNLPGGLDSENYLVVQSTTTLFSGQDVDTNDDGIIDPALGVTVLDGAAYNINPEELFVYGGAPIINDVPFSDVPDAFVRFSNNNTPFAKAAFYYGELAASPEETTEFAAPLSPNFPVGGRLTPGAPNVGNVVVTKRLFDFDGDNRDDISVFRPDGAVWFLLNSTSGFVAAQFGLSTDRLVPGDYDGDGRSDFAVWRPSTSTWFFAPVTNSSPSTQFTTFQFGEPTDIPVPADYDGDGRTNLAV